MILAFLLALFIYRPRSDRQPREPHRQPRGKRPADPATKYGVLLVLVGYPSFGLLVYSMWPNLQGLFTAIGGDTPSDSTGMSGSHWAALAVAIILPNLIGVLHMLQSRHAKTPNSEANSSDQAPNLEK
ncbi:hypothetical protein M0655_23280 (plasmid) [Gordonia amicalis]|uniref:hypothetical protein n=1 Tax=Gordonia TaxID=2053 RepID=UPI0002A62BC9|nr:MULTISPECIES: hypothetical protein [Gordonia]MBA5846293.1 hypothetical protein [Gordonia amicalis]MDH3026201.1 hypothetical protein [Gordonia alkanivorans]NKX79862.1 hypothetical protein [Gordonia amicalis]UOG23699.1 hypothetical protein MTX80_22585 [Gordonia amicalis]UPW16426.1 hypothetical protein M0655_23280 [Gordonia amicalis]